MKIETDFKKGDIVRIRQWDDMAEEFGTSGTDEFETINCWCSFPVPMKPLCGLRARLLSIDDSDVTVKLEFLDEVPEEHRNRWNFSTDMIELAEDEGEIIDVEPEKLQPVTPEPEDITELLGELAELF